MHERIPKSLEEEIMNETSVFLKRKEKKEKFQNDEELDIDQEQIKFVSAVDNKPVRPPYLKLMPL